MKTMTGIVHGSFDDTRVKKWVVVIDGKVQRHDDGYHHMRVTTYRTEAGAAAALARMVEEQVR